MIPNQNDPVRVYGNIKAKPEKVFDAWIDPKLVGKWMFTPWNDKVVEIKTKGFPDMPFSFLIERNGKRVNHIGEYKEVRRPHRLVFTWGIEGEELGDSRVAIDFEPNGDDTYITLTHRGVAGEYKDKTQEGWTKIVNALQDFVGR